MEIDNTILASRIWPDFFHFYVYVLYVDCNIS